jgi:hypothetical protein
MILMEVIPKGCDLSHYCEFLFSYFLFAVDSFLGGGLLFGQGSQKESCGKVFFFSFCSLFFFSFSFWLVFFGSSQSKANPSHTPSFAPFFSTYEWGAGGGGAMLMHE